MSWWVKIISIVFKPFPRKWIRALGIPLGFLWYDVFRFRRQIVLDNLTKAFPDWSQEKKIQVGRKSVYMLTENFFEFFLLPAINNKWIEKNVVYEGEVYVRQALEEKKGVLLLSLHLGHGDMLASLISCLGYPVHLITKFFKSPAMNYLWFSVRGAQGVKFIAPHGEKTPFAILKALKSQGLVGFVLDQHMGKPYGIGTRFFGQPAGTAYGLALFHIKTKAPIVPCYTYEGEDGKIHITFEKPIFYNEKDGDDPDREQTLVRLTQSYTDKLEEIVRRYPDQWMWVHRRWKWKGPV